MAHYHHRLMAGESYFGDFPGGYRQTPTGIFIPGGTINALGLNPFMVGANLRSVDPNNYPGTVHFGPPTEIIGPIPIVVKYGNSNLHLIEGPIFSPVY